MKVIGYLRVSTEVQNTDLQKDEILSFVATKGWGVVLMLEDKATGTNTARPQLQHLMRLARLKQFDVLVVWKLDRLFRSLRDMVNTIHEFEKLGISLVSVKDNIDLSSPSGRLMVHLISAFAQFEAAMIRERVMSGLHSARQKGIRLGRPKSINVGDALILRQQGKSFSEIAKILKVSKSCVHKSLSLVSSTNSEINIEITGNQKSIFDVDKTVDLGTLPKGTRPDLNCTTTQLSDTDLCHERDFNVTKGKGR